MPGAVSDALRKALSRIPADRFSSAQEFADALPRGMAEPAASPGAAAPAPAAVSRRGFLAAGAAAGLLLLGLGGGALLAPGRRGGGEALYRRLTFRRGMIRTARFSADPGTILYGALWEGDVCRVYTVRAESPESNALPLPPATPLAISREGEVALAMGTHFRGIMTYGTLARVPLAGGLPRELAENVKYADWSPDGRELAVVRRVEGRDRLEHPLGTVLHEAEGAGLSFPRVSPGGDRVALFELRFGLQGRVIVVDRSGRVEVRSPHYANVFGLAWHGERVWYTAADDRPLLRAIHAVERRGGPRLVARTPGNVTLHDVTPDGRLLVAHTVDRGGITVLPRGADRERDLSWHDASAVADISADGERILFSKYGHGGGPSQSVYLRSADGSPAVRLGEGRAEALSPDGRWAVVRSVSLPSPYLDLLPTGAGEARRLEHPGFRYLAARWRPDGGGLVVLGHEEGRPPRLWAHDLERGPPSALTPEGHGAPWALSPDGRLVAAAGPDRRLRLHPLDGGGPREVPGVEPGEALVAWIQDGLLVSDDRTGFDLGRIERVDPASGRRTPWREITPIDPTGIMYLSGLRVSADGRSYAYSWHRALSDLYLLEGVV